MRNISKAINIRKLSLFLAIAFLTVALAPVRSYAAQRTVTVNGQNTTTAASTSSQKSNTGTAATTTQKTAQTAQQTTNNQTTQRTTTTQAATTNKTTTAAAATPATTRTTTSSQNTTTGTATTYKQETVTREGETKEDTVWLRAKLEFKTNDGVKGLSDELIEFSEKDKWKKRDGYYYYSDKVESGKTIELMKSVQIPADWDNSLATKKFELLVTVEATECMATDTGWSSNEPASYSQTFELSESGAKAKNYTVKKGDISITLEEFQVDANGKETKYVNDKIITPGEKVSKIVRITVKGTKGSITEIITEIKNIPQTVEQAIAKTGDSFITIVLLISGVAALIGAILVFKKRRNGAWQ